MVFSGMPAAGGGGSNNIAVNVRVIQGTFVELKAGFILSNGSFSVAGLGLLEKNATGSYANANGANVIPRNNSSDRSGSSNSTELLGMDMELYGGESSKLTAAIAVAAIVTITALIILVTNRVQQYAAKNKATNFKALMQDWINDNYGGECDKTTLSPPSHPTPTSTRPECARGC